MPSGIPTQQLSAAADRFSVRFSEASPVLIPVSPFALGFVVSVEAAAAAGRVFVPIAPAASADVLVLAVGLAGQVFARSFSAAEPAVVQPFDVRDPVAGVDFPAAVAVSVRVEDSPDVLTSADRCSFADSDFGSGCCVHRSECCHS